VRNSLKRLNANNFETLLEIQHFVKEFGYLKLSNFWVTESSPAQCDHLHEMERSENKKACKYYDLQATELILTRTGGE
jgi:hypothetical protein